MRRSHEIDMTNGPILSKIILFSIPLMLTGIMQLLFNAADVIVVGKFAGSLSLAAVGSTGSLVSLLVNVFIGISTGANVLAANFYGAKDHRSLSRCVHSSIALSAVLGIFVAIWGYFLSTPMLRLMNTDPEVLPYASKYLQIYFVGIPATVVYNFGSSILRAIGDTDRPLRFLFVAGVVNVLLNLLLVIVFHMDVAGVAIATAVSQYVSATLVILCLLRADGPYQLHLSQIRFHKDMLTSIIRVGLPAGLQSTIFSISNVTIQSAINSFGYITMAGNSAAANIDGFIYIAMNAFYHSSLCFTSQNMGAHRYDRLTKVILSCVSMVTLIGLAVTTIIYTIGPNLLSLYVSSSDPDRDAVLAAGMVRLKMVAIPYFLCGIMEVLTGALRGLGKAWTPLIISLLGSCVFRVLWVYTVFAAFPQLEVLYASYPISWFITPLMQSIALFSILRKQPKRDLSNHQKGAV